MTILVTFFTYLYNVLFLHEFTIRFHISWISTELVFQLFCLSCSTPIQLETKTSVCIFGSLIFLKTQQLFSYFKYKIRGLYGIIEIWAQFVYLWTHWEITSCEFCDCKNIFLVCLEIEDIFNVSSNNNAFPRNPSLGLWVKMMWTSKWFRDF